MGNTYSKEFEFLISLCQSSEVYETDIMVQQLRDINWGELVDLSIRHSMLATLSHHVALNHEKLYSEGIINHTLRNFLIREKKYTLYLRKVMLESILQVSRIFDQQGILHVVNKGIVLETGIHYGDGRRDLGSDIDFMILPEDRDKAFNALKENGYFVGRYDAMNDELVEHSREEVLTYKFSPDHLLKFVLTTNKDFIEYIDIDIANSITWHNSDMLDPIIKAFKIIESIDVVYDNKTYNIKKFDKTFEFLFVIMHLYREAWFYKKSLQWNSDVNLKKFFDVYQYLNKHNEFIFNESFYKKLESLGFLKPFKWVVIHTDNVFGSNFSKNLDISDIDDDYLYSAFTSLGKTIHWEGDMKSRLFENNRSKLFL